MAAAPTDFSRSLEELTGLREGSPEEAPTPLIAKIQHSWKRPMRDLTDDEIGRLVVQHYGYPYLLDLVWPKLDQDPLFEGGYYPGAVLSNLIQADPSIWADRPAYRASLKMLYQRALERDPDEVRSFRESLGLPDLGSQSS